MTIFQVVFINEEANNVWSMDVVGTSVAQVTEDIKRLRPDLKIYNVAMSSKTI